MPDYLVSAPGCKSIVVDAPTREAARTMMAKGWQMPENKVDVNLPANGFRTTAQRQQSASPMSESETNTTQEAGTVMATKKKAAKKKSVRTQAQLDAKKDGATTETKERTTPLIHKGAGKGLAGLNTKFTVIATGKVGLSLDDAKAFLKKNEIEYPAHLTEQRWKEGRGTQKRFAVPAQAVIDIAALAKSDGFKPEEKVEADKK